MNVIPKHRNLLLFITIFTSVLFFLGIFSFSVVEAEEDTGKPIRVIVIGWDGVSRKNLIDIMNDTTIFAQDDVSRLAPDGEALPLQDFLPTLKSINNQVGKRGLSNIHITENTATKAGWAQILTGYSADVTGVYTNEFYKEIPDGYSIFGRLHNKYMNGQDIEGVLPASNDNVFNMMITGKPNHVGTLETADGKQPFFIEKKYVDFLCTDKKRPDYEVFNLATEGLNEYAATSKNQHLFAFIHFCEPDQFGHDYGEDSIQYRQGIELDDYYTGKIIEKLKELGIYEQTIIYIVTDHGFDNVNVPYPVFNFQGRYGKHHICAPYVFLCTNDSFVLRSGSRMDIAPTILKKFNIDVENISPHLFGKSLDDLNTPSGAIPVGTARAAGQLQPGNQLRKFLLISWSGANRARVKELLDAGQLPNLKALSDNGRLIDIDITRTQAGPGIVYPFEGTTPIDGIGCLVSGYDFETTGIYTHNRLNTLDRGRSIFEKLKDTWGRRVTTVALISRDVLSCRHSYQGCDNVDKILDNAVSARAIDVYDTYPGGLKANQRLKDDAAVKLGALAVLSCSSDKQRIFMFLHFAAADTAGHTYGEGSVQYKEALRSYDAALGEIINSLGGLPVIMGRKSETMVYVTASNGFQNQNASSPLPAEANGKIGNLPVPQGFNHRMGSYVFLATNDVLVMRHGLQLDIVPTILDRWGILSDPYVYPGVSLSKRYYKWEGNRCILPAGENE